MAWWRQTTRDYLSQSWPISMSSYGVTRRQRINRHMITYVHIEIIICLRNELQSNCSQSKCDNFNPGNHTWKSLQNIGHFILVSVHDMSVVGGLLVESDSFEVQHLICFSKCIDVESVFLKQCCRAACQILLYYTCAKPPILRSVIWTQIARFIMLCVCWVTTS